MGFFQNASPASERKAMEQAALAALVLFRWLPMVFFLLVAAQAFSTSERIPWRVFSWFLRRRKGSADTMAAAGPRGLNTGYVYFAVCIFGASITTQPSYGFYLGFSGLLGWALWSQRPRRFGLSVWTGLITLAVVLGFLVQIGLIVLNQWGNMYSARWLSQFMGRGADPKESRTAMGEVGRLKLSGRIMLRVNVPHGQAPPPLLREASYRFFKFPDWVGAGKGSDFGYIQAETNHTTWEFQTNDAPRGPVTIAQYLRGHGEDARRGLLAVPQGIVRLENLPVFLMSTNDLGVVRVDEGPGLVIYDAWYARDSTIDAPWDKRDLDIPLNEELALTEVTNQVHLDGLTPQQTLHKLSAWFLANFQYRTWLPGSQHSRTNLTVLGNFLLHDRAGHCEYFATAATLLLRKEGIPARYAVGYAVDEHKGDQYIVRERHGHAWCLAWINGAWRDFDVTPPSWLAVESGRASWLESLGDAWSRIWFEFSKWRWGQTAWRKYLLWIMSPMLLLLLVRMVFRKEWKRFRQSRRDAAAWAALTGANSEFYRVEQQLAKRGLVRPPNEPLLGWLTRVQTDARVATIREPLPGLLRLHYRYRFDPRGLDREEREKLRAGAEDCLERLARERR